MSYDHDGLGVDWKCAHCRKTVETGLNDEPSGWLVDDDADLYLCETCRTTSVLADPVRSPGQQA